MSENLSDSARRVQAYLTAKGYELTVVELPGSTRTAVDAANAVGCEVAHIVKSLIFRGKQSGEAVLIVASGINRVDEKRIKAILGEPITKADADFVRTQTGYAIGGVPPIGHANPVRVIMDEDLRQYPVIWAAAGTPHAVFRLTPDILIELTSPIVAAIK